MRESCCINDGGPPLLYHIHHPRHGWGLVEVTKRFSTRKDGIVVTASLRDAFIITMVMVLITNSALRLEKTVGRNRN